MLRRTSPSSLRTTRRPASAAVVADLREHAPDFDVLVVDDGSTDGTAQSARAAGAHVLRMPFNLGIGGTVQAGYQYALEHDYDYAIQVDGDGQHDAARDRASCSTTCARNPEVDMVTGSRFLEACERRAASSRRARAASASGSSPGILSLVTASRVTDPTSGFRMTNRHGIELFARDYPHDYPEVEAVLMVHAHRLQQRRGARCACARARAACRRSTRRGRSTT